MLPSTAVLVISSTALMWSNPDADRVADQIRDHFSRITSVRVRSIDRALQAGGLSANDPAAERPVYQPGAPMREFDVWMDPPKQRSLQSEQRGGKGQRSVRWRYFDGQTYTYLDPVGRTGLVMKGGSLVTPPRPGPLHGIGYCFLDTYQSSLASLLTDPSKVRVQRLAAVDGGAEWLVEVKSLPDDLRPRNWGDKARRMALVRIWVTIDPEVTINRWAVYYPQSGDTKMDSQLYGRPAPIFQLDGYNLHYGFVNVYGTNPARDQIRGRGVRVPRRILHGNGNVTVESAVREWAINPQPSPGLFLPALPAGFSITRPREDGQGQVSVTGGQDGSTLRVREITKEAREMLGTGDSLRAPTKGLSDWAVPIGCALLVGGGVVLGLFAWRRRKA